MTVFSFVCKVLDRSLSKEDTKRVEDENQQQQCPKQAPQSAEDGVHQDAQRVEKRNEPDDAQEAHCPHDSEQQEVGEAPDGVALKHGKRHLQHAEKGRNHVEHVQAPPLRGEEPLALCQQAGRELEDVEAGEAERRDLVAGRRFAQAPPGHRVHLEAYEGDVADNHGAQRGLEGAVVEAPGQAQPQAADRGRQRGLAGARREERLGPGGPRLPQLVELADARDAAGPRHPLAPGRRKATRAPRRNAAAHAPAGEAVRALRADQAALAGRALVAAGAGARGAGPAGLALRGQELLQHQFLPGHVALQPLS
mmetsp:Transcript_75913/g.214818  ORF Transcript_75913/g.214818 Transcript_75913/m.214818 type:complete len:309 (-) Transcript_75913:149-1075(-)